MYQVTLRLLADSEARTLNKLLFYFTLLSLITAITTLADFAVKAEEFHGFNVWRGGVVVGSFLLIFIAAFVYSLFRHKDKLRRMSLPEDIFDETKFQKLNLPKTGK